MSKQESVTGLYKLCTSDDGEKTYKGIALHKFSEKLLKENNEKIKKELEDVILPNMWANLRLDKSGNQWGEQRHIEMLVALGVASENLEMIASNKSDPTRRAFDLMGRYD